MDRTKQKRIWINQDIIDGPHSTLYILNYLLSYYELIDGKIHWSDKNRAVQV